MKNLFILLIIFLLLYSCIEQPTSEQEDEIESVEDYFFGDKDKFYTKAMKRKKISMKLIDDCEDALLDTIHKRNFPYIESEELSDSIFTVSFKFKSVCCQKFKGDYQIMNDTLFFEFEQVNDEVCSCICWYRYKLDIKGIKTKYKTYVLKGK